MRATLPIFLLILAACFTVPVSTGVEGDSGNGTDCDATILDISSSNYKPYQGDPVIITAKVYNNGSNATYVTVWFGNINDLLAYGEIHTHTESRDSSIAEIELDTSEMLGEEIIFIMIGNTSPDEEVEDKRNNAGAATISLYVQPADDEGFAGRNFIIATSLTGVLGVIALIYGSMLYLKQKRKEKFAFQMTDVFLVYNDGRLITHETARLRPDFDASIMSSMLTAIQEFVKDSFKKYEEKDSIKKLEYEDFHILIERGEYVYVCVALATPEDIPKGVRDCMTDAVDRIEDRFSDVLHDWSGNYKNLKGVRDILKECILKSERDMKATPRKVISAREDSKKEVIRKEETVKVVSVKEDSRKKVSKKEDSVKVVSVKEDSKKDVSGKDVSRKEETVKDDSGEDSSEESPEESTGEEDSEKDET